MILDAKKIMILKKVPMYTGEVFIGEEFVDTKLILSNFGTGSKHFITE